MDKAVELLRHMLEIYSPSTKERGLSDFLVKEMKGLGFSSYQDEVGNAIGEIGDGQKVVLLVGHMDTVSGNIPVRVEGNKIFGRGSVDAKGSMASFIMAASRIKGLRDKRIVIVGAVEEEISSSKGARNILSKYDPAYIIIGEPSGASNITIGYKGNLLMQYSVRVPNMHYAGSRKNASELGIDFYFQLKKYCDIFNNKKKVFETIDLSLRKINSSSDYFHQLLSMELEFRLPLGFDVSNLTRLLDEIKSNGMLRILSQEKPIKSEKNNDLVRAFLRSIRKCDLEPKFKLKTGTSDMNIIGNHFRGVPIVAYGPGDSSLDHTPDEYLVLDEFGIAINILEDVLREL